MTVKEVNAKLIDIEHAIGDVYKYIPKPSGYYEAPEPEAAKLLQEYAEMLEGLEVKVGGNV